MFKRHLLWPFPSLPYRGRLLAAAKRKTARLLWQPGYLLLETRGFPPPPRDGFGFFYADPITRIKLAILAGFTDF